MTATVFAGALGLGLSRLTAGSLLTQAAGPSVHAPPEQILINFGRLVKTNGSDAAAGRRAGSTQVRKSAHQRRSTPRSGTMRRAARVASYCTPMPSRNAAKTHFGRGSRPSPALTRQPSSRTAGARRRGARPGAGPPPPHELPAQQRHARRTGCGHCSNASTSCCRAACPAAVQPLLHPGMYCCEVPFPKEATSQHPPGRRGTATAGWGTAQGWPGWRLGPALRRWHTKTGRFGCMLLKPSLGGALENAS